MTTYNTNGFKDAEIINQLINYHIQILFLQKTATLYLHVFVVKPFPQNRSTPIAIPLWDGLGMITKSVVQFVPIIAASAVPN